MNIQTFSVIVGDKACNAKCPFCVSKGTPDCGVKDRQVINIRNFHKSCQFAKDNRISTILMTGKGEPLLGSNRDDLNTYLSILDRYSFPFIEIQTNGIEIMKMPEKSLKDMYNFGVTTFIISCVHYERHYNKSIYGDDYPELETLVKYLHERGFSVRLSCIMLKDFIDDYFSMRPFIYQCKHWKVEQLTFRPVVNPIKWEDIKELKNNNYRRTMYDWIKEREISGKKLERLYSEIDNNVKTTKLLNLAHGATVYDYDGQNLCISSCLTESTDLNDIRQIIFFPDGRLRYSWQYEGAILL